LAKINLDDILTELGVDRAKGGDRAKPTPRKPEAPKKDAEHNIDSAEAAFSPIPVMPANQGLRGKSAAQSV